MKKILTFLLCLGFAFSLAACRGNNGTSEETSSSSAAVQNSESGSEGGGNEAETAFFTVTAEYDYYVSEEPMILYNQCDMFFTLPADYGMVVAGDAFTIEHTGEAWANDCYPGEMVIMGEIVSVTAKKAETVVLLCKVSEAGTSFFLYEDGEQGEEVKIADKPQYYLTNDNGEIGCEELEYLGIDTVLYGTYSPVNGYDETNGYTLSGLYAWNPREE